MNQLSSDSGRDPSEVGRVEITVSTTAPIKAAFALFCDIESWHSFFHGYGPITWVAGEPWQVGSRLRIEIVMPIRTTIEHLITAFVQDSRVAWIDHSEGTTLEQVVAFKTLPEGGTSIETWAEMVGAPSIKGVAALKTFEFFTRIWYERFAKQCDKIIL